MIFEARQAVANQQSEALTVGRDVQRPKKIYSSLHVAMPKAASQLLGSVELKAFFRIVDPSAASPGIHCPNAD